MLNFIRKSKYYISIVIVLLAGSLHVYAEEIKKNINVVVVKNFPPHYSLNKTGKPQGFAIDSIEEIARLSGLKINYIIKNTWKEAAITLKTGEADLIPNIGLTQKRLEDFDFSIPIELSPISAFIRSEDKEIIRSHEDLKNRIIGIVEFNIGEKIAQKKGYTYRDYKEPETALIGLLSGDIDALIYPEFVMQSVALKSGIDNRIHILDNPFRTIKRAIAVKKDNTELILKLNTSINILKNSNTFDEIFIKWYGKEKPFWSNFRVKVAASIIVFLTIIITVLWRYYSLVNINKKLTKSISEKREVQNSLNKRQTYLHTLIETLPDLVWLKDPDGIYLSCNPRFEQFFGAKKDEIIGKTDYDFIDKKLAEFSRLKDKDAISAGMPSVTEEEITFASDGHHEIVETIKTPMLDSNGNLVGVLGIARDITERKKLADKLTKKETDLRETVNTMIDAVITIDESGKILTFNKSAETIFGYSKDEILANDINMLMPTSEADLHNKHVQNYLLSGKAKIIGIGREVLGKRKDGSEFPMRVSVAELTSDINGKRRFVGTCSDMTLYKQQEEQLHQSQKMKAVGKLTGGIAHDFNNILGIIIGYTELLKTKLADNPDMTKYVDEVKIAGERGTKLTKKLLSFSSQRPPETTIVDINTILKEEQDMLKKAMTAQINIKFNLEEPLWKISIDDNDLEDAIINMCLNSMHAMKMEGEITIETANEMIDNSKGSLLNLPKGEYVTLSVIDTGCGIKESDHNRIFEPFFTTKADNSSGLGLSQVYGFMKRSNGKVTVKSQSGKGASFTLYFPRYDDSHTITTNDDTSNVSILKGTETVLIIDDEPALLDVTAEILRQNGYKVFTANNADEALIILERESIALVLSDVVMPGMNGYQLTELIKLNHPHIQIQLASGFNDSHNLNMYDSNLHKNLLQKPFQSQTLLKRVRDLLDKGSSN